MIPGASPMLARLLSALVAAAGCCLSSGAAAQIVNVHSKFGLEIPEGVTGALEQSFEWKTGNTESILLGAGGKLRARSDDHTFVFLMNLKYKASDGDPFENGTMEHARYSWDFLAPLGAEVFAQHEYNETRRLRARGLLGAGPRLGGKISDMFSLRVGTAYMFEFDRLDIGRDDDEIPYGDGGQRAEVHRWSSYLTLTVLLGERLSFTETTYIQPRFDAFEDFRLLSDAALEISLAGSFSLKVSAYVAYDRLPPEGVEALDTGLMNSLSFSFGPV